MIADNAVNSPEKFPSQGSSLYYALLFLPPRERHALGALHALAREIGGIAHEVREESVARIKLAWWRAQIDKMAAGQAEHPLALALAPCLQARQAPTALLQAFVDGGEMDLSQSRYLDWPGLQQYCRQTGGALGVLSARLLGCADARALEHAETLGVALRLTRLLRDAGADARLGRIYLPLDDLQRFGVKAAEIINGAHSERFEALMRSQAERARQHYCEALTGFAALPRAERRALRPGLMLAAMQETLLDEIEHEHWQVLNQRIALTPLRKLWLAWKTWVFA